MPCRWTEARSRPTGSRQPTGRSSDSAQVGADVSLGYASGAAGRSQLSEGRVVQVETFGSRNPRALLGLSRHQQFVKAFTQCRSLDVGQIVGDLASEDCGGTQLVGSMAIVSMLLTTEFCLDVLSLMTNPANNAAPSSSHTIAKPDPL